MQPDISTEQITQDMNSSHRPKHDDSPADPSLSLVTDVSQNLSSSLNSNVQHNTPRTSSTIDEIKQWEIERGNDSFFSDDEEDIWGDIDDDGDEGWSDERVDEVHDRSNNLSTTIEINHLPQKVNITTASPDVRAKTNISNHNDIPGEMTINNQLTSHQTYEHTERISPKLRIDEATDKLWNQTTNTLSTSLPFERLKQSERSNKNSSSSNFTPDESSKGNIK